ncbi:MAG: CoB--CoM heterodisulfide reductase iron-sulfur subunit B family protein [Anaerolineae bacterium]|nr:CoB--CoM heterodisulfide reductase iron-sulfur subunit B family protein [Anaerolineae bacterium]
MTASNGAYVYYPGCSLQASAHAYDISTKRVAERLNLTFNEIDDWNCCGATEFFSINALPAYSLVARNLALAAQTGGAPELVAPCSACYLNLRKTNDYMAKYKKLNQQVNQALAAGNLHYNAGSLRVRHLLDIVVQDVGYEKIGAEVTRSLQGMRVAPYYGCLIVRPDTGYNTEYPTHLDKLMTTLGATVIDFPMKTHCCGGHMTQISEAVAYELIRRILKNAADYGADAIVTLCPMCQLNLDVYQGQVNRTFGTDFNIPILYFTQLMGIAFGMTPQELGFGSEVVSADRALAQIGREEPEERERPKRKDKQALPMPALNGGGRSES